MLELFVYPPAFGEITGSPFVNKAICLLEMAGLDYQRTVTPDPRKAPKRKLPVLKDGETVVPDSDQIRDYLEKNYTIDFDEGLTDMQRAVSRGIIRMVEEHLYFAIVSNRWQRDENWPTTRDEFFVGVPRLLKTIISRQVRKGVIVQLMGHGMGRFTPEEQLLRATKDIVSIRDLLGDQSYLFGEAPTAADASVVPMLRAIAFYAKRNPLSDLVLQDARLMAYIERGKERLYPA